MEASEWVTAHRAVLDSIKATLSSHPASSFVSLCSLNFYLIAFLSFFLSFVLLCCYVFLLSFGHGLSTLPRLVVKWAQVILPLQLPKNTWDGKWVCAATPSHYFNLLD